jgi:hypothetical protein
VYVWLGCCYVQASAAQEHAQMATAKVNRLEEELQEQRVS